MLTLLRTVILLPLFVQAADAFYLNKTIYLEPTTSTTSTSSSTTVTTTTSVTVTSTSSSTSTSVTSTTSTSVTTTTLPEPIILAGQIYAPVDGIPQSSYWNYLPVEANELLCIEWVPSVGIDTATQIAYFSQTGDSGETLGIAIYNYDGSSQIVEGTKDLVSGGTFSLSPSSFDIDPGTQYRLCYCASAVDQAIIGTTEDTGINFWSNLGPFSNAFATRYGVASNSCSSGNPPSTTGVLTAPSFVCSTSTCGSYPGSTYASNVYSSNCNSGSFKSTYCDMPFILLTIGTASP